MPSYNTPHRIFISGHYNYSLLKNRLLITDKNKKMHRTIEANPIDKPTFSPFYALVSGPETEKYPEITNSMNPSSRRDNMKLKNK